MPRPLRLIALLGLPLLLNSTIAACGSDGGNGPKTTLYESWSATSFTAMGTDFIASGMGLDLTFAANDTYTLTYTNDLVGACDPGPDCVETADFSHTATELTLDPSGPEPVTLGYSIQGNSLTLTGTIGMTPVVIVLEKV